MPRLFGADAEAGAGRAGKRYGAIPGALPDLGERVAGACAFAPRCAERFEPCTEREPDAYPTPTGFARCFLHETGSARRFDAT